MSFNQNGSKNCRSCSEQCRQLPFNAERIKHSNGNHYKQDRHPGKQNQHTGCEMVGDFRARKKHDRLMPDCGKPRGWYFIWTLRKIPSKVYLAVKSDKPTQDIMHLQETATVYNAARERERERELITTQTNRHRLMSTSSTLRSADT